MLHVISYEFFWNGLDPCKILSPKFLFIAGCTTVFPVKLSSANLEDKTKQIFASAKQSYCSVLQIGCILTDVQGVYMTNNHLLLFKYRLTF